MAREDPGVRVEKIATKKVLDGKPTVEKNIVGWANRILQLGAYVDPNDVTATQEIQVGEAFIIMVGGTHEVAISATTGDAPVGTVEGDLLWIRVSNNAISRNAPAAGVDEVQSITVKAKKGKFDVTFDGETVEGVKFNATALELQEALETLSNIDDGDVVVTGGPGDELGTKPYLITFGGQYADEDVPELETDATDLEEGAETAAVKTEPAGAAGPASLPLGVVDEIDATREVAIVNTNALAAFFGA